MKRLISMAMVVALLVSLFAFTTALADEPIKIGVSFATQIARRFSFDEAYMRKVAEANGAELIVQWANYEQAKQENQVENLLSQGIDVLILVAVSTNMSPLVDKVKAEGIPVVCYDNFIENADLDAYLDRDNHAAGVMQMEMTMEAIGGEGDIVILHGEPTSAVVQGMKIGYDEVLAKYPNVNVVLEQYCEGYSAEKALKFAENALTANTNIKAFVCTADVLSLGILPAVEAAGIAGNCYITGMDCEVAACKAIYEGKMGVSIWTEIDKCATRAAEIAIALVRGEEFEYDEIIQNGDYSTPKVFVPILGVTKDNMEDWVNTLAPEGWITLEEITG
ncbi:MAG: substrate-binding domain-containing protein [Clostridiales bacterium]|jgi:D-xylose transport system substrate-binding protein|nr:substrate-binding domain-containing protein [Clostridiales bacterium]OPZ68980.1 MAG: D-xylose-binding periplasmic protein precursor [Firmicutes bacterium ADurb.Bin467]